MFLYWGRRGAMPLFTLQLGRAALTIPGLEPTICVSRQNALFPDYAALGPALLPIDTFTKNTGAFTQAWRLPALRASLAHHVKTHRIDAVVDLMTHVWSPFAASAVQQAGARYLAIVHDADAHPGDPTTWVKALTDHGLRKADGIITLSHAVADRLVMTGTVPPERIATLFLPDLALSEAPSPPPEFRPGQPIALMFLGRIMPYKGFGLFLEMIEILRGRGHNIQAGVFGEGNIDAYNSRLTAIGAEVVNRWLTEAEIAAVLPRYHAVVLSHTEASQSGVTAVAFGAGRPVVVTPVGGLAEQVADGVTGTIASAVDAPALAAAVERLFASPQTYADMCANVMTSRNSRSMRRFVERCIAVAVP